MTILQSIVAIVLMLTGTLFLLLAAIGVLRFADALQRMHASTKTGTVGAGLVVIGSVALRAEPSSILTGILIVLFLLLTVPVAAHVLGRAAYVSGARFIGLAGRDALEDVLERDEPATPAEPRLPEQDRPA